MSILGWIILAGVLWSVWAWVAHRLIANPRNDIETGLVWRLIHVYAQGMHNLQVVGRVHVPAGRDAGPLVVVANHTAGVDPLLVQAVCPFFVRWMMAKDMQLGRLAWFWRWACIIGVDRYGREVAATRVALRHLNEGGVLGIFPEGTLERPPEHILPFLPGVGLIVHKSKARVLPVVIEGTPRVDPAWSSLWRMSNSTVRFLPVIDYAESGMRAGEIAEDLRDKFIEATGWPTREEPDTEPIPGGK